MKPFLGIDMTDNKENDQFNGDEFLIARPSPELSDALNASSRGALDKVEQARLPRFFRVVRWICGGIGVVLAVAIVKALTGEDGVSISEAYHNAGWLFWISAGCLLVWLILMLIGRKKEKNVLESEENKQILSNLDRISDNIYAELDVPPDARTVDILSFEYKIRDGQPKVREKEEGSYVNYEYKLFADSERLYLVDLEGKYAFPLSSLRAIRTVSKKISLLSWNKDIAPDSDIYKPFRISQDNLNVYVKAYHILELEREGEIWGIYFPNYELPAFEALTGLRAE